jgi:hypothetical protein
VTVTLSTVPIAFAAVTRTSITAPTGRRRRLNDAVRSIRARASWNVRRSARLAGQRVPRGGVHVMTSLAPAGTRRTRRRVMTRRRFTVTVIAVSRIES